MLEQIIGLHHQLGRNVTLQWISAHEGAYGNEAAGVAAREAARWRETQRSWTDNCSMVRRLGQSATWTCHAQNCPQSQLREPDRIPWTGATECLYLMLMQARTGKIGLKSYLHRPAAVPWMGSTSFEVLCTR